MAQTKVSDLAALTTTDGAEELLINDGGTSKKVTIANLLVDEQVTYAKIQNVSADERILGRVSGADGVIEELTKAQVLTFANVEDGADVTDTTNVTSAGALMDSELSGIAAVKATTGTFLTADQTKLDGIETSADVTDATNVTAAGALMDSELAGIAAVKATTGTFLTADQTKLDGIEASADVTDATNVTAAGALMDSELAGIAAVKATTGTFLSADESKLDAIEAAADVTDATNVASAGAGMLTVDQSWSGSQRGTPSTVTDGTLDLDVANNFQYTPAGADVFEFTNEEAGQSGFVKVINPSAHAISVGSEVKKGASWDVSTAGTYLVSYYTDGTNVYVSASEALS